MLKIIEKPNSSHNEQALWGLYYDKSPEKHNEKNGFFSSIFT